ncbi:hypothetical protein M9H77_11586 [Catharanthus roseus]|uniref:Uncharacterized protein n=1 Tax=Catharanthus roseus TaxID=4058 RepID=A0ACC0BF22_CATRO|nr:hypothetical protein M9H77_11586 [Catharanthus roseus]
MASQGINQLLWTEDSFEVGVLRSFPLALPRRVRFSSLPCLKKRSFPLGTTGIDNGVALERFLCQRKDRPQLTNQNWLKESTSSILSLVLSFLAFGWWKFRLLRVVAFATIEVLQMLPAFQKLSRKMENGDGSKLVRQH